MHTYNSDIRQGALDSSELDPCIAAETRLKKSMLSTSKKRALLIVLLLLLVLVLFVLFLVLVVFRSNEGETVEVDGSASTPLLGHMDVAEMRMEATRVPPREMTTTTTRPPPVFPAKVFVIPTTTTWSITTTTAARTTTTSRPTVTPRRTTTMAGSTTTAPYALISEEVKEDCSSFIADGLGSGIYRLAPKGMEPFDAYCDMDTERGGWMVMQRTSDGRVPFYNRTFSEYEHGFGRVDQSHWLGLAKVYAVAGSLQLPYTIRIELHGDYCDEPAKCSKQPNGFWYGEWDFRLGGPETFYTLHVSNVRAGNLSSSRNDNLFNSNGQKFTTIDMDNDHNNEFNCAQFRMFGGWWHRDCTTMALNGLYGERKATMRYQFFLYLNGSMSYYIHPRESIMMIRRKGLFA